MLLDESFDEINEAGADAVKLECHYNEGCSLLKSLNL